MSTWWVGTPVQLAIARFCVTPRTKRPTRVRLISSHTAASTTSAKTTIAMRLNGMTYPPAIAMPPDSHDGFSTSTFCAPNSERQAWISSRLTPHVVSSVSSGRPYSQRSTPRSSTMPMAAVTMNAAGSAATTYQSNAPDM